MVSTGLHNWPYTFSLYTDSAITDFYADDTALYVLGKSLEIIEWT